MADEPHPPGAAELPSSSAAGARLATVWHRVRSGEDPLAFAAVIVLVALAAGLLWFWAGTRHGGVAAASPSSDRSTAEDRWRPGSAAGAPDTAGYDPVPASTTTGPGVAVHVAGAVLHPGLYHLPVGSRVADAVASAGGVWAVRAVSEPVRAGWAAVPVPTLGWVAAVPVPGPSLGGRPPAGVAVDDRNLTSDRLAVTVADDGTLTLRAADGTTLSGFASRAAALAYDYSAPLRWFPGQIGRAHV